MHELELRSTHESQNFWNIVAILIVGGGFFMLLPMVGNDGLTLIREMSPFQFIILALATFRLTRLVVADFVTRWFRDMFMQTIVVRDELAGKDYLRHEKPERGPFRVVADLLGCPWCVGVWMAFVSLALYYLAVSGIFPGAWVVIYVFALAGAGEFGYATIGALLGGRSGDALLVDDKGVNVLSGQKHKKHISLVCTECGK